MRRLFHLLTLSALTAVLTSCAAIQPSASPADAQRVLSRAEQYQSGKKVLGNSKDMRVPLRTGQWVASLVRSKEDVNDVTLQIVKVAGVQGNTVTLEMEQYASTNGGERMVIQQRIRNFPVNAKVVYRQEDAASMLNDIEIVSVKIMDADGTVQEMPQLGLPIGRMGAEMLKSNVAIGEVRSEACESSQIKASRCYLIPFALKVLWMSDTGTTYAHSDIPITGSIRSVSQKSDIDVIGYGNSGATILIR